MRTITHESYLKQLILMHYYKRMYYQFDAPEIPDSAYDRLEAEIFQIEDDNPDWVKWFSARETVGYSEKAETASKAELANLRAADTPGDRRIRHET